MLIPLNGAFPTDKTIAGIHSIPVAEDGAIIFVWDKYEKALTTVGGRLDSDEDIDAALDRETMEEAGIVLEAQRIPFAAWYWESTNTYTVFVMARIREYRELPEGFETTGRVAMNLETARELIAKLEGEGLRLQLLALAEPLYIREFK